MHKDPIGEILQVQKVEVFILSRGLLIIQEVLAQQNIILPREVQVLIKQGHQVAAEVLHIVEVLPDHLPVVHHLQDQVATVAQRKAPILAGLLQAEQTIQEPPHHPEIVQPLQIIEGLLHQILLHTRETQVVQKVKAKLA